MQTSLNFSLPKHLYKVGNRTSGETHGVVLTKPHIVELLLDLAGYTADRDLGGLKLLEPSCGHGAFLVPAVGRLLVSAKRAGRPPASLRTAIAAFDIDPEHVDKTRQALLAVLHQHKVRPATAKALVEAWIREDDFLLAPIDGPADIVVGNPPYVRIEQFSAELQAEYRRRFVSLYDRADLYVAFIERGLAWLSPTGRLAFICADRWVVNKYGAPLRRLITSAYRLHCYIDLHKASPFESDVIAYPSIFVLGRGTSEDVPVLTLDTRAEEDVQGVKAALAGKTTTLVPGLTLSRYDTWFEGEEPWVLSTPEHLAVLRKLETEFEVLEAATRVGIGVATGNDKVYIVAAGMDVEADRLVPLVMRDDLDGGQIKSKNRFVLNTFDADGRPVDLEKYPKLKRYFGKHEASIRKRHVSQRNPGAWFRTIDRVYPELVRVPKLLIPDIAGSNEVVYEAGHYHPHHNLYFITSDVWDMEVLGGLLSSKVALFFVWSYAVKMRGGYLRFQAQYLRRIRLPNPHQVPTKLSKAIKAAFRERDFSQLDALALQVYGLRELPAFDFVDTRK